MDGEAEGKERVAESGVPGAAGGKVGPLVEDASRRLALAPGVLAPDLFQGMVNDAAVDQRE